MFAHQVSRILYGFYTCAFLRIAVVLDSLLMGTLALYGPLRVVSAVPFCTDTAEGFQTRLALEEVWVLFYNRLDMGPTVSYERSRGPASRIFRIVSRFLPEMEELAPNPSS